MSWHILSSLSIVLYFVCIQSSIANPERQIYKHIALVISVLSVGLHWGLHLENWIGVFIYLTIALEAYHNLRLRIPDILARIAVSFILLIGTTLEADAASMLIFIPTTIMMTVALYRHQASFYIVVFQSIAIGISLFFLLISYGSITWLNPSFILPETMVPADIFFLDHAGFFVGSTLLICLTSLSISRTIKGSIDTFLIVGASLLLGIFPAGHTNDLHETGLTLAYILVFLPILLNLAQVKNRKTNPIDHTIVLGVVVMGLNSLKEVPLGLVYIGALAVVLACQLALLYPKMEKNKAHARILKNILLFVLLFQISMTTDLKWLSLALMTICLFDLTYMLNTVWGKSEINKESVQC